MNSRILALWQEFKSANDVGDDAFSVAEFGDTPELANGLADLIDRGIKTATCSSYQTYLDENEAVPTAGSYFGVVTSQGDPVCICQVTDVRIGPMSSVDAAFAYDEGEDDRTMEAWFRAHRSFFRLPVSAPFADEDSFILVFERFRRLWP